MSDILKRTSVGIAALLAVVGLSSTAQANSMTLTVNGGSSFSTVSGTSNSITVTLFANLTAIGGGQNIMAVDVVYDSSLLTANGCREDNQSGTYLLGTSPSPHFGQVIGGSGVYAPFTVASVPNCGAGSPGDGGLTTPGLVNFISSERVIGMDATSGTLTLGTVTFHIAGIGTTDIFLDWGLGGFLGSDFTNRTTGALGSVSFSNSVIPEPATISLIGLGILGLGLAGRGGRSRRD